MADDSLDFDEDNAKALSEMLADPVTSENVRLQIIQTLMDEGKDDTFFETMYKELMSLSKCPMCSHENHWLVPEDDLNQFGWVSFEKDPRVKRNPTIKDCPEFQEACNKKRVTA
jgi:hypothetical protein